MLFFFFFKQKTAYEMLRSLVGSEMCIRDSSSSVLLPDYSMLVHGFIKVRGSAATEGGGHTREHGDPRQWCRPSCLERWEHGEPAVDLGSDVGHTPGVLRAWRCECFQTIRSHLTCLLYTSDAADEEDSVDLGGRRIIKKKKKNIHDCMSQIL
eukprot:TRINITY_DN54736_c0_g1_i1.p1 TRINITY_DN54736_c0_g1~~TRINITY_DN54736_c0_g1_i1.p1  ORF type:complete len:153 (-),score=45.22 TRINITY_DN54736_c0_g1_i1:20-478(-)